LSDCKGAAWKEVMGPILGTVYQSKI